MPTSAARTKKGFTLMEVLVALLIIAILAAIMAQILQGSLLSHRIQKQALLQSEAFQTEQNRQFAGEREEPILTLEERRME